MPIFNNESTSLTNQLIEVLECKNFSEFNSASLMSLAQKNKVLLQFLRASGFECSLKISQEQTIKRTIDTVHVLSESLKGSNYAFFKFLKPVSYVPSDIDIIVSLCDVNEIVKKISRLGYHVEVKEQYCVTLVKGSSVIDLYVHPTIGNVVYMDGSILLMHTTTIDFHGFKIITLEKYAEALMAAAHSIYKEKIYTLNDYFTIKHWVTGKSFKLAKELNCEYALKFALALNYQIEYGQLEMPYRMPIPLWFTGLIRKFNIDELTRATSTNIIKTIINDNRSGALFVSKLTRKTY